MLWAAPALIVVLRKFDIAQHAIGNAALTSAPNHNISRPRSSVGIDVSLSRGLDVVMLASDLSVRFGPEKLQLNELHSLLVQLDADIVAIDSPPTWATEGKSRLIERQLSKIGIHIYATPTDPGDHSFYRWMRLGFEAFHQAHTAGYSLFRGSGSPVRTAIEVFPHASAVVLRGSLPPTLSKKVEWRRAVLERVGVDTSRMTTADQLDAALAALTGLTCLEGTYSIVGAPEEGVLVLPISAVPTQRFARDPSTTEGSLRVAAPQPASAAARLCECGCGAEVRRRYLPGHDSKHRSNLKRAASAGTG